MLFDWESPAIIFMDSWSFLSGQILRTSRPFLSMSLRGIIASLGMGLLAAAIKFFVFAEKKEMNCLSFRTKPLALRLVTMEWISKSLLEFTAIC